MTFKDELPRDMEKIFFNPDEFAVTITWNGASIFAVPEENENSFDRELGTYETTDIFHVMKESIEKPEPESRVMINDKSRLVKSVNEFYECYTIEFYRNEY